MNRLDYRAYLVLIVSGALGFRVGMFGFPAWQDAVESAQVVAGIVKYPAGNPFYIYHTKLWTVLHQICALQLLSGSSEITVSRILSGVLGMVSLQALSMFVFALGRDALLAIGAAFVIFFSRAAENGVLYPIFLMGTEYTYGVIGLSMVVLVAALVGAGCYRLGGLLLGIAPAVHASLATWLWLAVAVCFVWDFKNLRDAFRPGFKYFLAGCAVAALSLAVHLSVTYDAPHLDRALAYTYLSAFVAFWDAHRQPVHFKSFGVMLNVAAFALAGVWLTSLREDLPRAAVFLLRFVMVSAALSVAMVFLSWVPADRVPAALLILMPSRLLNVNAMVFPALLIGLAGIYRERLAGQCLVAALLIGLMFCQRSMVWEWFQQNDWARWRPLADSQPVLVVGSIGLLLLGLYRLHERRRHAVTIEKPSPARAAMIAWRVARTAALAAAALAIALTLRVSTRVEVAFRDRTNDSFFAAIAAERRGLVLTGGSYHLLQLRTRRPVLLDGGGLDALPYAVEAGPAMERILHDVYGIDFFHPPPAARARGVIPDEVNSAVWEGYSREKWQQIRREYDVIDVVARENYKLDLQPTAQDGPFRLYRIPE